MLDYRSYFLYLVKLLWYILVYVCIYVYIILSINKIEKSILIKKIIDI